MGIESEAVRHIRAISAGVTPQKPQEKSFRNPHSAFKTGRGRGRWCGCTLFHSQPVEQRALGLLLTRSDSGQTPLNGVKPRVALSLVSFRPAVRPVYVYSLPPARFNADPRRTQTSCGFRLDAANLGGKMASTLHEDVAQPIGRSIEYERTTNRSIKPDHHPRQPEKDTRKVK